MRPAHEQLSRDLGIGLAGDDQAYHPLLGRGEDRPGLRPRAAYPYPVELAAGPCRPQRCAETLELA